MTDTLQKDILRKNLLTFLEKKHKSQKEVADAIGVSPQTFNTWCQGIAMPRIGKIQKLADYFGILKSDLLEEKLPDTIPQSKFVSIPVYGSVSAGPGCFAEGNIESYVEIPEEMARHGEFFGLRVRGDSMEPDIKDGDIVIVKKQDDLPSEGKTVVAIVNGDEGFCKRLATYAKGLGLVSNNPNYLPKYYSAEEVRDLPVRIIGVVQRLIRDF